MSDIQQEKSSFFAKIYNTCLRLSQHQYAPYFLAGNSFIESIFWPIPVDIMLGPMCLAKRSKAMWYALNATIASVLGAIIGYYLGYYCYDLFLADIVQRIGYTEVVKEACYYLESWGIAFVIIGSFTPIPYKVVAICCGMIAARNGISLDLNSQLCIWWFLGVSFLGRGARFFLIALLIRIGGATLEAKIRKYIDIIGWCCVLAIGMAVIYWLVK